MTLEADAPRESEIVELEGFFAPVRATIVDTLLTQYQAMRSQIESVADLFDGGLGGTVNYFISGNRAGDGSRYTSYSAEKIFGREGAIAALNADYWSKALALTDVRDAMPQARRNEWDEMIRSMKTEEFTAETVVSTIRDLLGSRDRFFAERVDGLFRNLSGTHVTNCPEGFSKRMILSGIVSEWSSCTSRVGYINDLRCVIAKFMGRDEPGWNASSRVVCHARENRGEWQLVDGGALRIRVYKIGTAHLEVHPSIAWRLNEVLSGLYPMAIPSQFRTKPKKAPKDFVMMERPLPVAVLTLLGEVRKATRLIDGDWRGRAVNIPNAFHFIGTRDLPKAVLDEAGRVMEAIGGVWDKTHRHWQFDYDALPVLAQIECSGCIPDQRAHQFYPTPAAIAAKVMEMAEIGPNHRVLEPSAGIGSLADAVPHPENLSCVEISGLHCAVLKAKGYRFLHDDFIKWAGRREFTYDRVVMNPPFSEGRWQAHLEAAASLVVAGGRIVAVLPATAKGRELLPGWQAEYSSVYTGEFVGTGVSVVIVKLWRAGEWQ